LRAKKHFTVQEALERLQRYCSYQDRCHQEVERKLREMGMHSDARAHIIAELISDNFLNEERFSKAFSRGKFNQKHWGRIRIKMELKARGLSDYNIRSGLKELEEEEYRERFREVASKAWESLNPDSGLQSKKKFWNYLTYRGWEPELIQEFVRQSSGSTRTDGFV
jgi:regulatory protein